MCKKALAELDNIIRRINTHPEYNRHQTQQFLSDLRREADNHSVIMEMEAQQNGSRNPWNGNGKNTQIKNRCDSIKRLEDAWNHLALHGLSTATLMPLGNIIEPSENNIGFRKRDVIFGDFDGSDPSKIMDHVYHLTLDLEALRERRTHPVMISAAAHIGLVNIHPYMDGNGRAARIVQEYILQSDGYTPAIIPSNEGSTYRKLMANVINDRRHFASTAFEPSSHERSFYEYIASKCLNSARNLNENLKHNRIYHASVDGVNEEMKFSLKHMLVGLNSKIPGTISVRMLNRRSSSSEISYEIKGDISLDEVRGVLNKAVAHYRLNPSNVFIRPYQDSAEIPSI